jgi:hypothetical protein
VLLCYQRLDIIVEAQLKKYVLCLQAMASKCPKVGPCLHWSRRLVQGLYFHGVSLLVCMFCTLSFLIEIQTKDTPFISNPWHVMKSLFVKWAGSSPRSYHFEGVKYVISAPCGQNPCKFVTCWQSSAEKMTKRKQMKVGQKGGRNFSLPLSCKEQWHLGRA